MEIESNFKIYALGYVASDIAENSLYVEIYPIEHIPNYDGKLTEVNKVSTSNTDIDGNNLSIVVDKSRLITAKWLPINNSNRVTPPNVCKGETVLLYNFSGTDNYFWNTLYAEPDLRKREKVTYFFSNKGSVEAGSFENNGYYLIVDTINKYIQLRTADNDGEYTKYDLTIDTKSGNIKLADGKDNEIILDSASDTLTININKNVIVNTTNVQINCTDAVINTDTFTVNSKMTKINP